MKKSLSVNPFKAALKQNRPQIGLWCNLCSPVASELVAGAGFDWLLFDSEHSPVEVAGLMPLLQAASYSDSHCAVRVAWNDPVLIKKALDIGAQTLLLPFVQSPEEAAAGVTACRYPPNGIRGVAGSTRATNFGRITDYHGSAERETCIIVQIETGEAIAKIDEIAAVEGIDGVFIGPSDLSASMGHLGNPGHPDVQDTIKRAAATLNDLGIAAGILATNPEDTRQYLEWGFTFVAAGVDTSLLANAADTLRAKFPG